MNKLSNNLKKLLRNAKISENELARRTGISQQIINRILSGENKNPKIATLAPLANYFMVSISELIDDELGNSETKLNPNHVGWQEAPLLDWESLGKSPLPQLLLQKNTRLLVDVGSKSDVFAVKMRDSSMEPKFSAGTLLIFESFKKPTNGDFILLGLPGQNIMMRQIFIKNDHIYKKCLNPKHEDYKITLITNDHTFIGSLIQSRTDYATH